MLDFFLSTLLLTVILCVVAIDNVLLINVLSGKLSQRQAQQNAKKCGMFLAGAIRLLLLLGATYSMRLTTPFITISHWSMSAKNLLLLAAGIFLLYRATKELYSAVEKPTEHSRQITNQATFHRILLEIVLLNVVLSLDSIFVAVGLAQQVSAMLAAVLVSGIILNRNSADIHHFIDRHPSVKVLMLAFLTTIGMSLIAAAFEQTIPKGYMYSAMGFALLVEMQHLRQAATSTTLRPRQTERNEELPCPNSSQREQPDYETSTADTRLG